MDCGVGDVERRDGLVCVLWKRRDGLWRGEMDCSVGDVERRDGLWCGCCGEERWTVVWVLWRGEMKFGRAHV
jgi:hypothetical protein